jgi:hypothetical protein
MIRCLPRSTLTSWHIARSSTNNLKSKKQEKFRCPRERINHISAAGTKSTAFAPA